MPERETQLMDWKVYADATCAGLTALIPIPFVDLGFETVFRRRMPGAIARARSAELDPEARRLLAQDGTPWLSAVGCLAVPVKIIKMIVKRFWRKLVYVFAIADAAEQTSAYWHRAFLLDHVVRAGHADQGVHVERTVAVFNRTLEEADTSALKGVARQAVTGAHGVLRLLRRARRGTAAQETAEQEAFLRNHWEVVESSLYRVAIAYNEAYARWPEEIPDAAPEDVDDSGELV